MSDLLTAVGRQLESIGTPDAPAWLQSLRTDSARTFVADGFPHRRLEAWKYIDLRAHLEKLTGIGANASGVDKNLQTADLAANCELFMSNGILQSAPGDLDSGLEVLALQEALAADEPELKVMLQKLETGHPALALSALNNASLNKGLWIRVKAGVNAGRLVINWLTDESTGGQLINSRVCVLLEPGAELELVENHHQDSGSNSAQNLVLQMDLADAAVLRHARSQASSSEALLITRTEISQGTDSQYLFAGLDTGGSISRHDLHSCLQGPRAVCEMNGAYLPGGSSLVDYHLEIEHQAPDCSSGQYFRGVMTGHGRAVFNGRVHVHPGADGTEARQSNANLLLSPDAEIYTKPELEIEADEVVASHGATVGQLDKAAIFYLRSRGLDEAAARALLTGAFCQSAIDKWPAGPVRDSLGRQLAAALGQ